MWHVEVQDYNINIRSKMLLCCLIIALFQHLEIHDTIAECMIFANHWVARKIAETFPNQAIVSRPLEYFN